MLLRNSVLLALFFSAYVYAQSYPGQSNSTPSTNIGDVTLTWDAPTQNTDNSALTDLVGYKIYWGITPGVYPNTITVVDPAIETYEIEGMPFGTYEFVVTAYNSESLESAVSNADTVTVN